MGAAAEDAAAVHLASLGWIVLARNVRIGTDEIDIIALEPAADGIIVVVEVRSRSGPRFGAAVESVDARKVARLYRAVGALRRGGHPALASFLHSTKAWRVDLLTLRRQPSGGWVIDGYVRGLTPP